MQEQLMYRHNVEAELKRMRADIDALKKKAAKAKEEERTRFDRYLSSIEEKSDQIGEQLGDLKSKGDAAKDDIQKGLKEAWDRVAIATEAAKARFH